MNSCGDATAMQAQNDLQRGGRRAMRCVMAIAILISAGYVMGSSEAD
jgi:hypothetical protein